MIKEIKYREHEAKVYIDDVNEQQQAYWNLNVFYETTGRNPMLHYIYNNYPKGLKYIDVGGSIGNHALFMGLIMGANVSSFEPYRKAFDIMKTNLELNNVKADIYNCAIGKAGFCSLSTTEGNIGLTTIIEGNDVEVKTLDSFGLDFDILKIDVEGHELEVLESARETIYRSNGVIFVETDELNEVDSFLADYGYKRNKIVFNRTPTYLYEK